MSQELILDRQLDDAKNTARMLYFIHGLTFVLSLGLLSIIPVFINYAKRQETQGTLVYSHHNWMIRSFWWYAGWMLLGWVIFFMTFGLGIFIAAPLWGIVWLWKAYRLVRGLIDLNDNKAMP